MDAQDHAALASIAALPASPADEEYAPKSDSRMAAAARIVIDHAETFPVGDIPSFAYIASTVMDLLHLADKMEPGQAADILRHVRDLDSDSGDELGLCGVSRLNGAASVA